MIFSVEEKPSQGKVVCLNKVDGKLQWERIIYDSHILTEQRIVNYNNRLFFVAMQKDVRNCLVEVDIQTGEEIKRINPKSSEWFSYSDYVTSPHIGFDGNNILVHGDKDFVYNIESDEIKKLDINGYGSIINDGNIIYHDNKSVFMFNIEKKSEREIFKLKGKQVLKISAEKEYILLVLANNIREDIILGNDLFYIMLKIE